MTALATKPSLTLVRRLKATPSSVYAAWTDPKAIAQWFGPHHTHVVSAETDVRVGGKFRVVMRETESGELHDVSGVYREVEPERKLVFSWAWVSIPDRESLVTVLLHPRQRRGRAYLAARTVLRRSRPRQPQPRLDRVPREAGAPADLTP